jgi:hypothetical protein
MCKTKISFLHSNIFASHVEQHFCLKFPIFWEFICIFAKCRECKEMLYIFTRKFPQHLKIIIAKIAAPQIAGTFAACWRRYYAGAARCGGSATHPTSYAPCRPCTWRHSGMEHESVKKTHVFFAVARIIPHLNY